ncbi:hypothetical protein [Glycomyces terrestris]|uniref:Secreted protein n=1 Tax=Glycomyces terrestris TaxID=2493553 RepID=A0A426V1N7_9ACTN|nr:hypothetical protein [Glycomyces terrestris]RRS00770.1 hypothetical protein EIW28_09545 [Glycomyces terrestris]
MLRKALSAAAAVGAAGMIIAATASPAAAGDGYEYDPDDFGGVNVLSNICAGNWNGNLVDILKIATVNKHDTCNGWDQNPDGVNVGSNLCLVNWDWQGALVNGGKIATVDDYKLCNWSAEELEAMASE